jgi:hypothetical protein
LAAAGAVRAVVEAGGPPGPGGRRVLAVALQALGLGGETGASVAPASSACLAEAFGASRRRALVDALLVAACAEGEVGLAGERVVRGFARDLGVRSPWVGLLPALRRRRVRTVAWALARRSPDARRLLARTWAEEGLAGLVAAVRLARGTYADPPLAARFRALGGLAEGTVGRAFYDHLTSRGLALPGEPGGLPERMVHHDLLHVLNGYDTDPAGECELAGFYAGAVGDEGFAFVAIALATFHLGLAVSPAAVTPARGAFDPARVLAAYVRGRGLNVDPLGAWNYWALMPLPLAKARDELGIGPGGGSPA